MRISTEGRLGYVRLAYVVLAVLCALALISPALMAQTSGTGGLTGTVTDASGAAIPGATVTVTGDAGQARTAMTGQNGSYTFNLLPPGNYKVRFTATGFKSTEVPSATVTVTESAVLDQRMEVGSQTQEVTVSESVETVQTSTSSLGTVVTAATVTELPLSTRNYENLIGLSAGANTPVYNATNLGKDTSPTAVNGADISQNNFQLDGVAVDNWLSFGTGIEVNFYGAQGIPMPDAIAEFKIQTSTYDAGYGRNSGANVDVVTKSGTNDFHGSAFEFFRNSVLNANDWFVKHSEATHLLNGVPDPLPNISPVLDQNQYGGVFGGPIKKDKLYFFVAYQETSQKNGFASAGFSNVNLPPIPNVNRGTCPPGWTTLSQCDANAQAFVPLLAAATCPTAGTTPLTHTLNTTTLAGGINVLCAPTIAAPLAYINPVAISILQLKATTGPTAGGYYIPSSGSSDYALTSFTDPARYTEHQGMGNWDYVINGKNTLSGRYFYATDPQIGNFATSNTSTLPGSPWSNDFTNHEALLKLTTILSSNLVNEARVSYQRNLTDNNLLGGFTNSSVGITNLGPNLLPLITITGAFGFGNQGFEDIQLTENQFQFADQISYTHGKHTIRTGAEFEKPIEASIAVPGLAVGQPTFNSFADFLIGRASCAPNTFPATCNMTNPGNTNGTQALSNMSSPGATTNAVADNGQIAHEYRASDASAFIQDDIKLNSRLTVNVGVRWEYDGFAYDKHGAFSSIFPNLVAQVPIPPAGGTLVGFAVPANYEANYGPVPTGVAVTTRKVPFETGPNLNNFAPRLGVAWQPLANNAKWVVRAGAGYFYERNAGQDVINFLYNSQPFELSPGPGASATLADPWVLPPTIPGPPGTPGWTPRTATFTVPSPGVVNGVTSNIATPTEGTVWNTPLLYQWNLNTQYEFAKNWVLQVGYIGSHGIHEPGTGYSIGNGSQNTSYYNLARIASPSNPLACGYDGVPTDCITNSSSGNTLVRVPLIGFSPQATNTQDSSSYLYNGLQVTVRHQFSKGFQFEAAYTWARAFATVPWGIQGATSGNPVGFIYGLNPDYRPQRLAINYSWDLPFGHPGGLKGKFVEGWNVTGVTTFQNGVPLTVDNTSGGAIYGAAGLAINPAQFCAGMGPQDLITSGGLEHRVLTGYLNKAAVCPIPTLDGATGFGNAGPGLPVYGPGQQDWDISIIKNTVVGGIRENATLQFRTEFYNAFNHENFAGPVTNAASGAFGQITASSVNPRLIQFALKYQF